MNTTRPYWKVIVSLIFSLLATALVVVGGVWLIRFLMPFVIGWIISCIANPVVCWLDKKLKIQKRFGSAIMIVFVLAAVVGLLYLIGSFLVREAGELIVHLPEMYKGIAEQMKEVGQNLSGIIKMLPAGLKANISTLGSSLGDALGAWVKDLTQPTVSLAGNVAKQIPSVIIGGFVSIISAYFFVADREMVTAWMKNVTPKAVYERLSMVMSNFKFAVGGYFIAQFKIMAVVCVILLVGLSLLRVEYAFVLSILIGFLDFLPFFGTGTALIPWCIYTLLTGDYMRALLLALIYVITQVVRQLIQPKLVGDQVGLNPLPTLVFIYIGYRLGGFLWMILAVPLGMILINMCKAGAFDYIINDVKILVQGILELRKEN